MSKNPGPLPSGSQSTAHCRVRPEGISQIESEKAALQGDFQQLRSRNETLEAAEKDLETRAALRAAQIVAETGTQAPVKISPKGDVQASGLYEKFAAITDPTEQTAFCQNR